MPRSHVFILWTLLAFAVAGCGNGDPGQPPAGSIEVKSDKDTELPLKNAPKANSPAKN